MREKNFCSPHSDWLISDRTFRRGTNSRNDIRGSLRHANLRAQYATALQGPSAPVGVQWGRCKHRDLRHPGSVSDSAMIAGFQALRLLPRRLPPPRGTGVLRGKFGSAQASFVSRASDGDRVIVC